MKRFNWLLAGLLVLCLAVLLLGGCVSKSEYEVLQAKHATLVEESTSLKAELEGVQSDLTTAEADYGTLESEYEALQAKHATLVKESTSLKAELEGVQSDLTKAQADYDALKAEHAVLVDENNSLKAELEGVQSDLTSAQADLTKVQADYDTLKADYDKLNTNYDAASEELAEIKEVYPPQDFSSLQELRDWLLANDVSERPAATTAEGLYSKALEIQEDALKDGYIISAWIDYYAETQMFYVNCTAVADGYVWMWDPQTDEPINFSDATGLLKLK